MENLYGSPSVGHRVTGKVTLNPSQFSSTVIADYTFTDPYLNREGGAVFSRTGFAGPNDE